MRFERHTIRVKAAGKNHEDRGPENHLRFIGIMTTERVFSEDRREHANISVHFTSSIGQQQNIIRPLSSTTEGNTGNI